MQQEQNQTDAENRTELSDIALRLDEIQEEINQINEAMEPQHKRLKELKEEREKLKVRLQPKMVKAETKKIKCDNIRITRRVSVRMPTLKPVTIEDALRSFFTARQINIDPREVIAFIHQYRRENSVQREVVSINKATRGRGGNAHSLNNMRMTNRHPDMLIVEPEPEPSTQANEQQVELFSL